VVAPLRLESAHSKVSEWIRPIPQGVDGRELKDLTVSPETVLVEVAIEQELAYRSVPVVAQLGGSPGLGYQILGVTVEPNTLTVVGEPTAIGQLRFLNIKPIELNRTTKDLTVIGEPLLPEGVSLARNQPVTVKVAVGAVAGSQTFSAVPTLLGLAPELESTMEPNVIQVVLSGPMPVLGLLNPRDIQVNLKVEGLPSGVHLLKPDIVVPSSIAVERTTPQQITVTLRPIPPATPTAMPVPQ
jgi:YbbR domain-containing protein